MNTSKNHTCNDCHAEYTEHVVVKCDGYWDALHCPECDAKQGLQGTLLIDGFQSKPRRTPIKPKNQRARNFVYRTPSGKVIIKGIVAHKRCVAAAEKGKHYYRNRKTKEPYLFESEAFLADDDFYVYEDGSLVLANEARGDR